MEPVAPKLPAAFGSAAAMVVASISLFAQTSPMTCLLRATAAFVVFSAFGIVIRYLLADGPGQSHVHSGRAHDELSIEDVVPGTSVNDLLSDDI